MKPAISRSLVSIRPMVKRITFHLRLLSRGVKSNELDAHWRIFCAESAAESHLLYIKMTFLCDISKCDTPCDNGTLYHHGGHFEGGRYGFCRGLIFQRGRVTECFPLVDKKIRVCTSTVHHSLDICDVVRTMSLGRNLAWIDISRSGPQRGNLRSCPQRGTCNLRKLSSTR